MNGKLWFPADINKKPFTGTGICSDAAPGRSNCVFNCNLPPIFNRLLYHFIKPVIRLALLIYCRKVYHNRKDMLRLKGPLILAVNHPNSFLDAVMVGAFFKQPVHFLARGDAFKKSWALKILSSLKCIPVYRLREGREFLHLNDDTFERCRAVFRKGGIVLIFSEGLCINEWNLRPLRKGTARLAFSAWKDPFIGNALRVLPVGVSYDSFHLTPKQVFVQFGSLIQYDDVTRTQTDGHAYSHFNELLTAQLIELCFRGVPNQPEAESRFAFAAVNARQFTPHSFEPLKKMAADFEKAANSGFTVPRHFHCAVNSRQAQKSLLVSLFTAVPAAAGFVSGYWLYRLIKYYTRKKLPETGHYDSVMFGLLALLYPLWVFIAALMAGFITGNWPAAGAVFAAVPLCAWALTVFQRHFYQWRNYRRLNGEQRRGIDNFFKTGF